MRSNRRLTDAEHKERRERDRQRLHQATEQLLSSEGWRRWFACGPATAYRSIRSTTSS